MGLKFSTLEPFWVGPIIVSVIVILLAVSVMFKKCGNDGLSAQPQRLNYCTIFFYSVKIHIDPFLKS